MDITLCGSIITFRTQAVHRSGNASSLPDVSLLANRAFIAFSAAFGVSAFALFASVGRPFGPSVPILLYSAYLWLHRERIEGPGGETLRDSPYFLGFLLTMTALLKLFGDASAGTVSFAQNPAVFTSEVGSAILTTVVGLFSRQALQTLIPSSTVDDRDERLERVAAALSSHAVQLERSRQDFLKTMSAETDRRQATLAEEQQRFFSELRRETDSTIRAATTSAVQELVRPTTGERAVITQTKP